MKVLIKTELAVQARQRFEDIPQTRMVDIIETIFDLLICHFQNGGGKIVLRGFGVFKIGKRRAFTGMHPQTGEALPFAERKIISYKPSAEVSRRINS